MKSKTLKLSRVIEYYVAESLKLKVNKEQGYLEIKTNELPITRRVYNLILKRNPLKQKLRSSIGSGKKYMVTLLSPGNQIDYFECSENTYILDEAEEACITLPFSSRAGADGASAGRIINGEVDHPIKVI